MEKIPPSENPRSRGGNANWSRARSSITHDWLSSKHFIGRLSRWQRVAANQIDDAGFGQVKVDALLAEWVDHRPTILTVIEGFPEVMSPRTLLDRSPLTGLREEQLRAIAELVHGLWLRRYGVADLTATATAALASVDAAFQPIFDAKDRAFANGEWLSGVSSQQVNTVVEAARRLHDAISSLHSRVRVV